MPTTPNEPPLKFTVEEVNAIDNLFPMTMSRIKSENPRKSEVIESIKQCSIAHFACNGQADTDPSKSRISLSDHALCVSDMVQLKLDKAEFAYISACHAANNREHDLLDEAIHMGGAFQLAGFPCVISTLWHISNKYSAKVAKSVYRAMMTADNRLDVSKASSSLHFAIREVKEELSRGSKFATSDPLTWAPYICVGV